MNIKTYILYKTIRPTTGQYYIGVHTTRKPHMDGYQGSGNWVKGCLERGIHLITGTIEFFDSEEAAYAKEATLVTWAKIHSDPLMMNRIPGGLGGWHGMTPEKCAIRNQRVHPEDERKKLSEKLKAYYKLVPHHTTGKPKPPSQKLEMSKSQRGRTFSDDSRRKMSQSQKARYELLGVKPVPPSAKGKKFNMKLVECPRCGFRGKGGNMTRYHFDKCRN